MVTRVKTSGLYIPSGDRLGSSSEVFLGCLEGLTANGKMSVLKYCGRKRSWNVYLHHPLPSLLRDTRQLVFVSGLDELRLLLRLLARKRMFCIELYGRLGEKLRYVHCDSRYLASACHGQLRSQVLYPVVGIFGLLRGGTDRRYRQCAARRGYQRHTRRSG